MLSIADIEQLCDEGESNRLDFKRTVYSLKKEDVHSRSELVKDILSFANSRRTERAYILCGIDRDESGAMEIKGVDGGSVPDDATIQQFVNSKLNREVPFLTYVVRDAVHVVWVIDIEPCLGLRPFYIKNSFGELKANDVWVRQGSSSRLATPDDVAKMVKDQIAQGSTPKFDVKIQVLTQSGLRGEVFSYRLTSDIPEDHSRVDNHGVPRISPTGYEEFVYLRDLIAYIPVVVNVTNVSCVSAENIRIDVDVLSQDDIAKIHESPPALRSQCLHGRFESKPEWGNCPQLLTASPGEPIENARTVYLVAEGSGAASIRVVIYSKQLPKPYVKEFPITIGHVEVNMKGCCVNLLSSYSYAERAAQELLSAFITASREVSDISHIDWTREGRRIAGRITSELCGEDVG